MSNGPPTDEEVAEDYKYSLEFLTTNDRYAINNLTVIARENTEHAPAISKVLEAHIRKVKSNFRFILFTFTIDIIQPVFFFLFIRCEDQQAADLMNRLLQIASFQLYMFLTR